MVDPKFYLGIQLGNKFYIYIFFSGFTDGPIKSIFFLIVFFRVLVGPIMFPLLTMYDIRDNRAKYFRYNIPTYRSHVKTIHMMVPVKTLIQKL